MLHILHILLAAAFLANFVFLLALLFAHKSKLARSLIIYSQNIIKNLFPFAEHFIDARDPATVAVIRVQNARKHAQNLQNFFRFSMQQNFAVAGGYGHISMMTSARRSSGRQGGGSAPARRQAAGSKNAGSDDGDGGDGGDGPNLQRWLSRASLAHLLDLSPQTISNKVCLGTFPKPVQTIVGPRWPESILNQIVVKPTAKDSSTRGRGRPRISSKKKGGAK